MKLVSVPKKLKFAVEQVVSLLELIRSNVKLNKIWFTSDITKIRTQVIEAQTVANEIKNAKEKLMALWEPEILSLDYAPILLRYKTEYTNIFKVFKGQYKQDKKQILALSKTVLKKLSDDSIIELLTTLKLSRLVLMKIIIILPQILHRKNSVFHSTYVKSLKK